MPRQLYLINFVIAVCVGYGLTLVGSVCPAVAQTAPLQVTLTTNKSQYSLNDPIVVTIRLKNVSSSDVVIPKIEPINDGVYVLVDVQHESGVTVFFLDPFNEKPLARAATTEVLPAGAERVFVETLNGGESVHWVRPSRQRSHL